MTQTTQSYDGWIGRNAYDSAGEKIGEITDVFYDDRTGRPEWVTVKTGLFKGDTFVPIHGSQVHHDTEGGGDDNLRLAFTKDVVKDAPRIDSGNDHLTPMEEQELWQYYGYDYQADPKLKTHGYGTNYTKSRADKDYEFEAPRREDLVQERVQERGVDEVTEEVPVKTTASVEVPVDTTVRLRRYKTTEQKTRTVEVPYTETTEHTEVADVQARAGSPTTTSGSAEVGRTQRPR
jgi:hypothetical protein